MKKILAPLLLIISALPLNAQLAEFQILIPAPEPAVAGEEISFQILGVNKGSMPWPKGKYETEVEIYDKNKNYLLKTSRIAGEKDVSAGGSFLFLVPFKVPSSYSGQYYFRVALIFQQQRIAYSDYIAFNITPLAAVTPLVPKVKIGGNAIFSYRNDSSSDWQNHLGNVSLNLLGNIYQKAVVFNLYTNHSSEKNFDIYNILFSYYSDLLDFSAGDVMPNFSGLSLSNAGVRGLYPVLKTGIFNTSIIAARSVEPVEGSTTTVGRFARYTYGVNEKISLPLQSEVGFSYVFSADDKNSISVKGPPGTEINAAGNEVIGLNLSVSPLRFLSILADFARSSYQEDMELTKDKINDDAYRVDLITKFSGFNLRLSQQNVGTNFYSFASPVVVKDRLTQEMDLGLNIKRTVNLSLGYSQYSDNLQKDPTKITTEQKIASAGLGLNIAKLPALSISYSNNEVNGITRSTTVVENYTNSYLIGISYPLKLFTPSFTVQQTKFVDKRNEENNRDGINYTVGLIFSIYERYSFNLGFTNSKSKKFDESEDTINNLSLNTNFNILPQKLIFSLWGNNVTRQNTSPSTPPDTTSITFNAELTYYLNEQIAWTIGAGQTNFQDKISSTNNYQDTRANTRLSINF